MKKTTRYLRLAVPLAIILFCAFGFMLAPNDPDNVNMGIRFLSPCANYPLGTDNMGRCMLSRLLYGGRTTLGIVLAGSLLVSAFGIILGLLMGGGSVGHSMLIQGFFNAVTAIPPIAYLIIFIAAWGNSITTMLVAVTVSLLMRLLKLVKTRTEVEMRKAYVMCAVAAGSSKAHILFVHVLPNLIWDVLRFVCLSGADMILSIVGFSFIGLGLGDDVIDWGTMVSETHNYIIAHPALTLYPIFFVFLCTLSFNLIGRWIEKESGGNA